MTFSSLLQRSELVRGEGSCESEVLRSAAISKSQSRDISFSSYGIVSLSECSCLKVSEPGSHAAYFYDLLLAEVPSTDSLHIAQIAMIMKK